MKDKYDLENKNHKVLEKFPNPSVTKLFSLYKKNRQHAKIFFLSEDRGTFTEYTEILFYTSPNEFEMVIFEKTYGISVTSRIFSNEKRISKTKFTKNGIYEINYYKSKPTIRTVKLKNIRTLHFDILTHYRPWTKFLSDNLSVCGEMTFNKIYNQKLFSEKKLIQYTLQMPLKAYNKVKNAEEPKDALKKGDDLFKFNDPKKSNYRWIRNRGLSEVRHYFNQKWVKVINKHLLYELLFEKGLSHNILIDTIKLARNFDKPVNLNWSVKRFTEEHDTMSIYITNLLLELENRDLNVHNSFIAFADFSGFDLFTTTKGLGLEGQTQKHCVATYADTVDYGKSGIFHINGYTLELTRNDHRSNVLSVNQIRGFRNSSPSEDLLKYVDGVVKRYNETISGEVNDNPFTNGSIHEPGDDLPF